jgi:hypothetical protein
METGRDGHLPFLGRDIYRRPDWALGRKVYRKPNPTNLHLNSGSHHHPSNKQCILSTLVQESRTLCDKESLDDKLDFLKTTFRTNGYSTKQTRRALNLAVRTSRPKEKPPRSLVFSMSILNMTGPAECWPDTTVGLYVLACRLGRSPVSFVL